MNAKGTNRCTVPGPHNWQSSRPASVLKEPAGQFWHLSRASVVYELHDDFQLQLAYVKEPVLEANLPATQVEHAVADGLSANSPELPAS